jgi:hypothetical protein
MAAKRKKMKQTKVDRLPQDGQNDKFQAPTHGPVPGGRAGVGRGQAATQARRYAFRRS